MPLKNPRWEKFAQALASGDSQRTAYKKAYPSSLKWKDEAVDVRACMLANNDKVAIRLNELKERAATKAVLSREEKRMILKQMALDKEATYTERQRAIDIDNKMEDEYRTIIDGNVSISKLEDLI